MHKRSNFVDFPRLVRGRSETTLIFQRSGTSLALAELGSYRVLNERARGHRAGSYAAIDRIHQRKVILAECPNNLPVEEILQRLDDDGRVFTLECESKASGLVKKTS